MAKALTLKSDTVSIDVLATFTETTVAAGKLAEGMVILDDLGTPAAIVDHRMRSQRDGLVRFMLIDLDDGGRHIVHAWVATASVTVAVA